MRVSRKLGLVLLVVVAIGLLAVMPATAMAKVNPSAAAAGVVASYVWEGLPDEYENDDTTATAQELPQASVHTFDSETDEDWFTITAEETGTPFVLETLTLEGAKLDTEIHVHSVDASTGATTELTSNDDSNLWWTYASTVYFVAPAPGTYHVAVIQNSDGDQGGYVLFQSAGIARRIAGMDRYETSAMVSRTMFSGSNDPGYFDGPDRVVIASGVNPADALAASTYAAEMDCPVLLTKPGMLPDAIVEELNVLPQAEFWDSDKFTAVIVGGTGAVSQAVEDMLVDSFAHIEHVERIAGANRFATAAAIATATAESDVAFIYNGYSWADAMAAGPVAGAGDGVMLPVQTSTVPSETLAAIDELGITDFVLVGGEGVVGAKIASDLATLVPGATIERVAGATRYETAANLAAYGVENYDMEPGAVLVSGRTFADGLSAAPMAYMADVPLLLTEPTELSEAAGDFLFEYGPTAQPSYVVGGSGAVWDDTFDQFNDFWFEWLDMPI